MTIFLQRAGRVHKFLAMSLLTLAVWAGKSPRVRASQDPVDEPTLPAKAKLYFVQYKTVFVGNLELQERDGQEFLRGTREGAPERELTLAVRRSPDGRTLRMAYANWNRGAIESQGYLDFGPVTEHSELGEGREGLLVQTHQSIRGRLVEKRESVKVFMQLESLPDDVVIPGPGRPEPEPEPLFTAPRPISKPQGPEPQPEPLPQPGPGPEPEPQPGPGAEPGDELPEPAPLPPLAPPANLDE